MSYQSIYNQLRAAGVTEAGALGVLGNWYAESGCEPWRLQGDFSQYRSASKQYTKDVEAGKISRDHFAEDSKGYGLAQWTYFSRKEDLYDFWKKSGSALDNEKMQVQFALHELSSGGEYSGVWDVLRTTDDIWTAVDKVCRQYERPYYNNVDERFRYAKKIESEIDLDGGGDDPDPEPDPDPQPEPEDHRLELRTIDKRCSGFPEVYLLQSVLLCRNYIETEPTDTFGSWLEEIVKKFQEDHGLIADGIVGPLSWTKLLERR